MANGFHGKRTASETTTTTTMTVPLPPFVSFKPAAGTKGILPAIIVIQEWWGVNDQIKLHAQKLADLTGAEAIIPDLYKGKIGLEAEEASHLMDNLDFKNAVDEIEVLCAEIQKDSPDRKIGVVGFCMGGSLALATAALIKKPLAAVIPFYGIPPEALCDCGDIVAKTPIQGKDGYSRKRRASSMQLSQQFFLISRQLILVTLIISRGGLIKPPWTPWKKN
jgi:carboxymethylenebutenolidase